MGGGWGGGGGWGRDYCVWWPDTEGLSVLGVVFVRPLLSLCLHPTGRRFDRAVKHQFFVVVVFYKKELGSISLASVLLPS